MTPVSASPTDKHLLKSLRVDAEVLHSKDGAYRRKERISLLMFALVAVLAVFALKLFIFEPTPISGISMMPTLQNGERMFVDKTAFWFSPPARGDVITCYYPNQALSRVKRVVGLPGERIAIVDGVVLINGIPLDESAYWQGVIYNDMVETTIPTGHVFVLGDNRNNSGDSRRGDVGPIPYYRIEGKARLILLPISALRKI